MFNILKSSISFKYYQKTLSSKHPFKCLNFSISHSHVRPISTNPVPDSPPHLPVMLNEVISYLNPKPGSLIVDMTFGAGGHTEGILRSCPNVTILALDRDPVAFKYSNQLAKLYPNQIIPLLGRFSELPQLLKSHNIQKVDGVLFDLGASSMQFDNPSRGFSVSQNGPLDMRMDGNRLPQQPSAADIIQHIDEEDLVRILKVYGEEKSARKISRALIESRYNFKRLNTTFELSSLISSCLSEDERRDGLGRHAHVGTKTFQALRIFVNDEMNQLHRGMELAHEYLVPNGTLVALTFHSLEDRIVKRHLVGIEMDEEVSRSLSQKFRNSAKNHTSQEVSNLFNKKWTLINKHVITPSQDEIIRNPRSRSAKLRAATKNQNYSTTHS